MAQKVKMLFKALHVIVVCGLFLASLGSHHAAAQSKPDSLVTIETGELPIILSAPHGGRDAIPGVLERQGEGVDLFNPRSDSGTDHLTEKLADALEKRLGKRPYIVIACFHRKYVDANRPKGDAYESEKAKSAYDTYHQALAKARRDVIRRWGHGILFDIHGQGAKPKAIFRGTQNGKTATHLVSRFGRETLCGETSVFGQLAKQGFPAIPAVGSTDREHLDYDGGYIVITYGSASGGTLDAIQLELGRELRSSEATTSTASKLANAITAFANEYLPKAEQGAEVNNGKQRTEKVRVGVYRDAGAGPSVKDLMGALRRFDGASVRELTADDIRSGRLSSLDVLIQPGGSGGGQGRHLREEGRQEIRKFIREGGGYIGICAGAYLASADYPWSLNVLDAKVIDRKHWVRGKGTVDIALTDVGQSILRSKEQQLAIFYAQGPLLAPGNHADIADYETMATFKTEIAKNGAPEGIMKGTTAIAPGSYGRGRVICFSPHPEMTKGLETLVHYAIIHANQNRSQKQVLQPVERNPDASNP